MARIEKLVKRKSNEKDYNVKVELNLDYDKFGDERDFILLGEVEIMEDKLIDGMRQTIRTGVYRDFKHKISGEKISMEFKNPELAAEKNGIKPKA